MLIMGGHVHTHLDRSWIDLSSHLSVYIQIALDLDRSQIDLTHASVNDAINSIKLINIHA